MFFIFLILCFPDFLRICLSLSSALSSFLRFCFSVLTCRKRNNTSEEHQSEILESEGHQSEQCGPQQHQPEHHQLEQHQPEQLQLEQHQSKQHQPQRYRPKQHQPQQHQKLQQLDALAHTLEERLEIFAKFPKVRSVTREQADAIALEYKKPFCKILLEWWFLDIDSTRESVAAGSGGTPTFPPGTMLVDGKLRVPECTRERQKQHWHKQQSHQQQQLQLQQQKEEQQKLQQQLQQQQELQQQKEEHLQQQAEQQRQRHQEQQQEKEHIRRLQQQQGEQYHQQQQHLSALTYSLDKRLQMLGQLTYVQQVTHTQIEDLVSSYRNKPMGDDTLYCWSPEVWSQAATDASSYL